DNPRLITCSIPAYVGPDAGRWGVDALVAAHTGTLWDQRGYHGGPLSHARGQDLRESDVAVPEGSEQTGHRDGPIFLPLPWPSLGAGLLAALGVATALFARQADGRGRSVQTSLMQGAMWANMMFWQRSEYVDTPGYRVPFNDRRTTKGLWQCADGLWLHQWSP